MMRYMSMSDYISGEQFVALADDEKIFYRHTHDVNDFFRNLPTAEPFVLISHNSDGAIESFPARDDCADINLAPHNLIHWFGQNVNIIDHRITSLPIGIENAKWRERGDKLNVMSDMIRRSHTKENLVYMNHNISTNPEERKPIYDLLERKPWVTSVHGVNGHGFVNYILSVCRHPFVICPMGHGIDTHRTWETLYMGSIPIEKRNINNQYYTDLPICFVNDWEEVTEPFLIKEYERIKNTKWDLRKLTFSYWKGVIRDVYK